jgi:hypothetical protein
MHDKIKKKETNLDAVIKDLKGKILGDEVWMGERCNSPVNPTLLFEYLMTNAVSFSCFLHGGKMLRSETCLDLLVFWAVG